MNKTRNITKLWSLVMVLMMVVSTMVIMPLTASAAVTSKGGDGSEGTPFLVADFADLLAVRDDVLSKVTAGTLTDNSKVYVDLLADIEVVSGFSLGKPDSIYAGGINNISWQFDGNGFALSGFDKIVFGSIGENATIENLTLTDSYIRSMGAHSGALVGYGKANLTITNCVITDTVTFDGQGDTNAGAFVGAMVSGSFTNCISRARVLDGMRSGGFVGRAGDSAITFTNCISEGTVNNTKGLAGGFIGITDGYATALTFVNCINRATVTAKTDAAAFVASTNAPKALSFTNCYDEGKVVANGTTIPRYNLGTSITVTESQTLALESVREGITLANPKTAENTCTTKWDGSIEEPALLDPSAENSAANPYLIDTPAKLAYFSGANTTSAPTAKYWLRVTKHLDLNNVEWTGLNAAYGLSIDGGNYTISNLMSTGSDYRSGLLQSNAAAGVVVDVFDIHFVAATNRSGTCGTVLAYFSTTATLNLNNVTVDANSKVYSTWATPKLGGLVGDSYGGAIINMTNCISAAWAYSTNNACTGGDNALCAGGLVGKMGSGATYTIQNCIVEGGGAVAGNDTADGTPVDWNNGDIAGVVLKNTTMTNVYVANKYANTVKARSKSYCIGPATVSNCHSDSLVAAADADAIATINKMGLSAENVTLAKATNIRLKLTDDFGFMPIAPYSNDIPRYNPHIEYGIVVNGDFVGGGEYYVDDDIENSYCVKYTGVSVATMNQTYSYQMAVMVGGELIVCEEEQEVNCYDRALAMSEKDEAELLPGEKALYVAMLAYHDAYKGYLTSNGWTVGGAN